MRIESSQFSKKIYLKHYPFCFTIKFEMLRKSPEPGYDRYDENQWTAHYFAHRFMNIYWDRLPYITTDIILPTNNTIWFFKVIKEFNMTLQIRLKKSQRTLKFQIQITSTQVLHTSSTLSRSPIFSQFPYTSFSLLSHPLALSQTQMQNNITILSCVLTPIKSDGIKEHN